MPVLPLTGSDLCCAVSCTAVCVHTMFPDPFLAFRRFALQYEIGLPLLNSTCPAAALCPVLCCALFCVMLFAPGVLRCSMRLFCYALTQSALLCCALCCAPFCVVFLCPGVLRCSMRSVCPHMRSECPYCATTCSGVCVCVCVCGRGWG